jgi:hypothetical protein
VNTAVDRWVGGCTRKNFLARRPENEDVDLAIRSEGGGEQVAAEISFAAENPLCHRGRGRAERAAITLHEELPIAPTWRANCQMVRSGQATGVLIPVV